MAKSIWKLPLSTSLISYITIPRDSTILSVQVQDGNPVLWAIVDPTAPTERVRIDCFPTGDNAPESRHAKFIGTVQIQWLVLHYFYY